MAASPQGPAARADAPAAGWYPDPEASGRLRWFDGAHWTQDRRDDLPEQAPEPAPELPAVEPPHPGGPVTVLPSVHRSARGRRTLVAGLLAGALLAAGGAGAWFWHHGSVTASPGPVTAENAASP